MEREYKNQFLLFFCCCCFWSIYSPTRVSTMLPQKSLFARTNRIPKMMLRVAIVDWISHKTASRLSSIFQREGKLHCSLTGWKLWSQVKKCSRHLIYARACVKKDFVHSGSIGLREGKHARYVINYIRKKTSHPWLVNDRYKMCSSMPTYCYNSKTNKECGLHIKNTSLKTWVTCLRYISRFFPSIITHKSWEIKSKTCKNYKFPREAQRFLRI